MAESSKAISTDQAVPERSDDARVPPRPSSPPGGEPINRFAGRRRYLRLNGKLGLEAGAVVETSAGVELKITYGEGEVTYNRFDPANKLTTQIAGKILSGSDWVTARTDGVLVFDSRITLQFDTLRGAYLLDGTLRGMLDLAKSESNVVSDADAYSIFVRGSKAITERPISLTARFEGSAGPAPNDDSSWLPQHLKRSVAEFPTFKDLVRQEFVAEGTLYVQAAPYYPPTAIVLDVWGQP